MGFDELADGRNASRGCTPDGGHSHYMQSRPRWFD